MKPTIALTLGDPAGVGPEIVARICHDEEVRAACRLLVIGRSMLLSAGALACNLPEPEVDMVEAGQGAEIKPGLPSAASGRQAGAFIEKACELCLNGQAQAMVTAPISKEALQKGGYADTGHTTMLARLTGVKRPVMMLAGSHLKVIPVTVHVAIKDVPGLLTRELIIETAQVAMADIIKFFGIKNPRLAVAALNPHAGEQGLFGDEESRVIEPAVQYLREKGINAQGPFSPDTVFFRASKGEFDFVLCMYHDQGLIPMKLLNFYDGVNVTLGLPLIRTSVDHGTAYDIAGTGKARADSLKSAVMLAAKMAKKAFPD
ncbi:4-hydroxythreonine-4-phosphate dehydrogenase PdxA [Dethiosulfatarculus sandiegensis]|uniref:4-hydroxythreonine-4-phosphate dehydrogenase n=1 Tax=Dethiosulfatarculus sandiegensis TaxID=1429043 RepID=A0A0D2HZX4_9BACT|nr:4-hydroxythreonine-4-phosphate dehydrogenase PdxA [Dethiosulfatarculus sandiegensis]KIX15843.1 4-hydroxythreonine-4-phosphate dehydrogenase [Dethiosulfatarculus sandiegensis]